MTQESEYPRAKFLRLQNGDDVVSELVEMEDDDGVVYMLINPLKVVYIPTGSGSLQVGFVPWVFSKIVEHQEFVVHLEDVLMMSNVSDYMNGYYWKNVTTYTSGYDKSVSTYDGDTSMVEEELPEELSEEDSELLEALQEMGLKRTYH